MTNFAATYEIYQNLEFSVSYDTAKNWGQNNTFVANGEKKHFLLDLEGLF